jgi:hypothetical protein
MRNKVLLIDDQYDDESIQDFILNAKLSGIEIVCEKLHKNGIDRLLNDLTFEFSAVILDATGYFKDEKENELSNTGLKYSLKSISDLKNQRLIPWFVFTGAPRNKQNNEFIEEIKIYQDEVKFGRTDKIYYTKTLDDNILIEDIITEIENIENKNIEYQYKNVFQICRKLSFPDDELIHFVDIIKSLQFNNKEIQPSLYFTQLRKYVEYVFRDAARLGLLHSKCIDNKGKVNLTESSLFLSGEKTKYLGVLSERAHFPKILSESIKNLIFISGAASHTADVNPEENMDYQNYRELINTPYLLYHLTFTVCDLIIWYETYSKTNSNIENNKSYWKEFESKIVGTLDIDEDRNYFIEEYYFNTGFIKDRGYIKGDLIEITGFIDNNNYNTKNKYPKFANKFKKL